MITVHHLDNSRSQRILWLLEEMGVAYNIKLYKRGRDMLAPSDLKAIHPLGKAPVITDGDLTLAESGAIIDYLVTRYGAHLVPAPGSAERQSYTYWMYAAEGSFMTPLLVRLITQAIPRRVPFFVRPLANMISKGVDKGFVTPNLSVAIDLWEQTLSKSPWFAGDAFSAADIMMSFPLEAAASRAGAADRPHIRAWLQAIHARPAYLRALERGGLYAYA